MKAGTAELGRTLSNVIEQVDQMQSAVIRESEFKQTFLPLILSVHNGDRVNLHIWTYRTGSIFNGFTVVDDVTEAVLFKTPGVYVNSSFEVDEGFSSLLHDVADAQKLKLNTDHVYAQHLNNEKAKLKMDSGGQHLITWYKIFARYGYKMVDTSKESAPVAVGNQGSPVVTPQPSTPQLDWSDDEFA